MKLIEKTCPKCGANLEFNISDKEVKCSYCNKQFIIEQDKNIGKNDINSDNYTLTEKVGKGVFGIILAFLFIAVISFIAFIAIRMFK